MAFVHIFFLATLCSLLEFTPNVKERVVPVVATYLKEPHQQPMVRFEKLEVIYVHKTIKIVDTCSSMTY